MKVVFVVDVGPYMYADVRHSTEAVGPHGDWRKSQVRGSCCNFTVDLGGGM